VPVEEEEEKEEEEEEEYINTVIKFRSRVLCERTTYGDPNLITFFIIIHFQNYLGPILSYFIYRFNTIKNSDCKRRSPWIVLYLSL
jgi:hypothetical protein